MKLKIVLTVKVILLIWQFGFAQIDYNKIVLPKNVTSVSYQEKLVQLAWNNNPTRKIFEIDENIADLELKDAKNDWLDLLSVNANLNEFTIDELTGNADVNQNNLFYPRYNVNLSIPLSTFSNNSIKRRKAEQLRLRSIEERKLGMLEVRAKVLILYKEFLKNQEILRIRTSYEEDEKANFKDIEERFKGGNATFEEYSKAQKDLYDQKMEKAISENNYQRTKLLLEQVIGIPLEMVTLE